MEVKKIVEGMTAPQVAQVIDENFNGLNDEKANKSVVKSLEKLNLLDNEPTKAGYFDRKNVFVENEGFVAVENVKIQQGCIYAYTGNSFSSLYLVFLDDSNEIKGLLGGEGKSNIQVFKEETYTDGNTRHLTSAVFEAPAGATKVNVSSWLKNANMMGFYEVSSNINKGEIYSSLNDLLNLQYSQIIENSDLESGTFWLDEGEGAKAFKGKRSEWLSAKIRILPNKRIYASLIGNEQAKPLIWLDKDGIIIKSDYSFKQTDDYYAEGFFTSPINAAYLCVNNSAVKNFDCAVFIDSKESSLLDLETIKKTNLLFGKDIKENGYFIKGGEFVENVRFFAVEDIDIVPGSIYVYNGVLFGGMALNFYSKEGLYVGSLNSDPIGSSVVKILSYSANEVTERYEMIMFVAPKGCAKMNISSMVYNIPASVYCVGTTLNVDDIEQDLFILGKTIKKTDLSSGRFWRNTGVGEITEIGNNAKAFSSVKEIDEGTIIYVKSEGNEIAPPIMWVDERFVILDIPSLTTVKGKYKAPAGTKYVCLNAYHDSKDVEFEAYVVNDKITEQVEVAVKESLKTEVKWTIPSKIYAIKGQEKSIYLDNIVNRNDDAPNYSVEVYKSFGNVDLRRFYFTPDAVGTKTITLNAWGTNGELFSSKNVTIEVVDNVISSTKRVVCIGDSVTEGRGQGDTNTNIPHHIKNGIEKVISTGANNIVFVGSKGTTVKHEGWWGRSYQWLANNQQSDIVSPLVNPDTNLLDIAYYRTQKCGLSENEKIDVVSLAMGFNNTNTENNANDAFSSMQAIISAFKADNPNTKFIVHLVTYPAMGNVKQENGEQRMDKKNSLYYFRQLCMNAYNNNQDANIFIGDLGLGYDRWYAYIRETVHPASYYEEDSVQVVTDRVHPSYRGAMQMAENIIPCIVKAAK